MNSKNNAKDNLNVFFNIETLKNINEKHLKKEFNYQKPHRINHYKIFIITTGIGQHIIDFKKYNFSTGSFIFIAKNQVQSFDFKPGNSGYVITFSENYLKETIKLKRNLNERWIYNFHFKKPSVQVVAKEQEYFTTITDRIFYEFNKEDTNNEIIQTLLNLLLLNSEKIKKKEILNCSNTEYCNIFFNFKNLIESKYNITRNVKHYAIALKISYKHLNNICKLIINKTAKQFIDEFIILEAKRYLLSSNLSIKSISEHLGFDQATNFNKYFKKHLNLSPAKFRNKNLTSENF